MRIAKIERESTAEVKGHFADLVYVQGCNRDCAYCFNKELIPEEGGVEKHVSNIIESLSDLSNVLVVTGGEPNLQKRELKELLDYYYGKVRMYARNYTIVETAILNKENLIFADKILFTFKTFDLIDNNQISFINEKTNHYFIPCVIVGHKWFKWNAFVRLCRNIDKLYYRFYNDIPTDIQREYHIAANNNTKFKRFDQICL